MNQVLKPTMQHGYALVLMLLALMAMGGLGIASFTENMKQEAAHEKYLHNQRVLSEAKQALLQFAYRYPRFNSQGPGRLPCPDTDNDGQPGAGGLSLVICQSVGRFPWDKSEMNFYDARDADGERLWYAVSNNFYNLGGGGVINSDTLGTISMHDRTGSLMQDASQDQSGTPHQGIAAVIIAPGAVIDRAGVTQNRSAGADLNDPTNYLDQFANGIDNASFVNSTTDGFVLGPIEDTDSGNLLVNDQIIIITAAEVIEMAEKATLEAYRDAILDYLDMAGNCTVTVPSGAGTTRERCEGNSGVWSGVYPWLYNYNDITYALGTEEVGVAVNLLGTHFPANSTFATEKSNNLDDNGRIPSIFGNYFAENSSGDAGIETDLQITVNLTIPTTGLKESSSGTAIEFTTAQPFELTFDTPIVTNVRFENIGTDSDNNGRLWFTVPAGSGAYLPNDGTKDIYYWDEDEKDVARWGVWRHCPDGGNGDSAVNDCHRTGPTDDKVAGAPDPEGSNGSREEILKLIIQYHLFVGDHSIDFNYDPPPTIVVEPATADRHARVTATFNGADVISSLSLNSRRIWDEHYHEGSSESLDNSNNVNVTTDALVIESVSISMRYYPELPRWIETNGWHNSVKMAYAENYRPGGTQTCVPTYEMSGAGCLKVDWYNAEPLPMPYPAGPEDWHMNGPNDVVSLLLIAREHGWVDGTDPGGSDPEKQPDGDLDSYDLRSVFDWGNENGNTTYFTRRESDRSDRVLVIEEL